MTCPSTDATVPHDPIQRRAFLAGASSLLFCGRTLAQELSRETGNTGCLSAAPAGMGSTCYLSPVVKLRPLEEAVPDRETRRDLEQATAYVLDIGEQVLGFRPKVECYNDLPCPNPTAVYDSLS